MNLLGPEELAKLRTQVRDPELRKKLDKVFGQVLDVQVQAHIDEKWRKRVAFYVPLTIFAASTITTIILVILATLKKIQLDEMYLKLLWTAFVVEMVGIVGWIIRRAHVTRANRPRRPASLGLSARLVRACLLPYKSC